MRYHENGIWGIKKIWERRLILFAADIVVLFGIDYLTLLMRFEFEWKSIDPDFLNTVARMMPMHLVAGLLVFWIFRLYHSLWQFAGSRELFNICVACVALTIVDILLIRLVGGFLPKSFYAINCTYAMFGIGGVRMIYRYIRKLRGKSVFATKPGRNKSVMVIGAGDAGRMIIDEIQDSEYIDSMVCCVIDDDINKHGCYIHGVRIVGGRNTILENVKKYHIEEIIIAMPSQSRKIIREILDICKETGCDMKVLPGIYQLVNDEVQVRDLRKVDINDLLGREPIIIDDQGIQEYLLGKTILITGGGGSIGSELCRQIAERKPAKLIIFDIYENNAYDIQQELKQKHPDLDLVVLIGSVRNTRRIDQIFATYRPDIVYHAAAHKHVPLMEDSPQEAIKNNVLGTWKTVQAAERWRVKRFVLISTDKAVNPTNIMGASKRLCEMIVQMYNNRSDTEFVAVRFGNVLGSNGSVIPLFQKQIENGGPVTVTHPDIIRYFMTISEAVALVLQAGAYAKGGEIFVLDMGESVKILDLATNLIKLSGYKPGEDIEIVFTGLRPGEKLYEELLMDEEGLKTTENKMIHIGKPIEFDEDQFMKDLEELKVAVEDDAVDIKAMVMKIVPTYKPVQ